MKRKWILAVLLAVGIAVLVGGVVVAAGASGSNRERRFCGSLVAGSALEESAEAGSGFNRASGDCEMNRQCEQECDENCDGECQEHCESNCENNRNCVGNNGEESMLRNRSCFEEQNGDGRVTTGGNANQLRTRERMRDCSCNGAGSPGQI